jgi:hypothetical protein
MIGQRSQPFKVVPEVFQELNYGIRTASRTIRIMRTCNLNAFSSSFWLLPFADAVHGSRCNRFNSGAPRRASRFRLQYLHTSTTNSRFCRTLILPMYCRMRSTMIFGTSGGPGLYVFAYARAVLEDELGSAASKVPSVCSRERAARRASACSRYRAVSCHIFISLLLRTGRCFSQ